MASNYGKDMLRQMKEITKKCDGLSRNMKIMKQEHKIEAMKIDSTEISVVYFYFRAEQ